MLVQLMPGDTMLIEQAPTPEEIFWRNIGLPSEARKTGALLSVAATATLCFFWSIPVAFLSSLTEVKSLKETLPFLERWVEAAPAIENMLALIAPLLLLILTEVVLPPILYWFATWEGLIASPQLEASTFVKLSTFVVCVGPCLHLSILQYTVFIVVKIILSPFFFLPIFCVS